MTPFYEAFVQVTNRFSAIESSLTEEEQWEALQSIADVFAGGDLDLLKKMWKEALDG